MKNTLLLAILFSLVSCVKKNKETSEPIVRDTDILDEEELEGLPESK